MGNEVSREQTKVSKGEKETIKKVVMQDRITNIDNLQEDMIESIKSGRITTREELVNSVFYTETAKEQIKKGGSSLTKVDLIAIILLIEINKNDISEKHSLESLKSLTVNDLNSIIRSIIYDPNRYVTPVSTNPRLTNTSSDNQSLKIQFEELPKAPEKPKRIVNSKKMAITNEIIGSTSNDLTIYQKK